MNRGTTVICHHCHWKGRASELKTMKIPIKSAYHSAKQMWTSRVLKCCPACLQHDELEYKDERDNSNIKA